MTDTCNNLGAMLSKRRATLNKSTLYDHVHIKVKCMLVNKDGKQVKNHLEAKDRRRDCKNDGKALYSDCGGFRSLSVKNSFNYIL